MSIHPLPVPPVPEETARLARAAFRRGNPYLDLRDHLGPIFQDGDFLPLYGHAGGPALSPALLALVIVLQYMENLTDEQAAEQVRARMDWKYLLGLPLDDAGFDASVLSELRTRMVAHDATTLLLDRVVEVLRERGLIRERGQQRTDSTRVLMAVRALNRLELVGETMRHALNTLAIEDPAWIVARSDPAWVARYGMRFAGRRLPQAAAKREALARQIGADGVYLLAALDAPETPPRLRDLAASRTLRLVWSQQYETSGDGPPRLRPGTALPPAAELIRTPYDLDARWSVKRAVEWTGFIDHLTETCDADLPHLLTVTATVAATTPDCTAIGPIQDQMARRALLPDTLYMDAGYVTGTTLVHSAETHGITVIGPVQTDTRWQARAGAGFAQGDFSIDWAAKEATCPQGKTSSTWRETTGPGERARIQVHFRRADCGECPAKAQCTTADRRSITLRPQAEHEALLRVRLLQAGGAFPAIYAPRAGIEGTISQAVRRSGLRVARYRGLAKTQLQLACTAAALNLTRIAAWLAGDDPITARRSAYASLMAHAT
jgi:transposase